MPPEGLLIWLEVLKFALPALNLLVAMLVFAAVAHGRLLSIDALFRLVTTSLSVPWLFVYTIQQLCKLLVVLVASTVAVTLSHIVSRLDGISGTREEG